MIIRFHKIILFLALSFLAPGKGSLFGQENMTFNISGAVYEANTNLAIPWANILVFDQDSTTLLKGTASNAAGEFELLGLTSGIYRLVVTSIGYNRFFETLIVSEKNSFIRISLVPSLIGFTKLEVEGSGLRDSSSTLTSIYALKTSQVLTLAGGQNNVINLLKAVPGVTSTSDFSSQLIVRGGDANQNLFLLDEIEIYSPYQANGIGSLFNPSIIQNITFYSGAYPAQFGDRLSSVLVVNTTTGQPMNLLEGSFDVNATMASATLRGRSDSSRLSWVLSSRKTYFDSFANTFSKTVSTKNDIAFPNFYDLTGKIEFKPTKKQRFLINGLHSNEIINWIQREDQFGEFENDESRLTGDQGSRNSALGLSWDWFPDLTKNLRIYSNWYKNTGNNDLTGSFRPGLSSRIGGGPGEDPVIDPNLTIDLGYTQKIGFEKYTSGARFNYKKGIHQFEAGGAVDILVNDLNVDLGLNDYGLQVFDSFASSSRILESLADTIGTSSNAYRYSFYAQNKFEVIEGRLFFQPGVRFAYYESLNEGYFLPRASFSLNLNTGLVLRGGYGKYVQSPGFEKLLEPDNIFNVTRFQNISLLKPEKSHQFVAGISKNLNSSWIIEIEGYFKAYTDLVTNEYVLSQRLVEMFNPTDNSSITPLDPDNYRLFLEDVYELSNTPINNGTGESLGLEFIIQKAPSTKKEWGGWVSYVLSKSTRSETFLDTKFSYPFNYDRRHTLNLVLNKNLTEKWSFGLTWRIASGLPYTEPIGIRPLTYTYEGRGYFIIDNETGLIRMNPDFGDIENINQQRLKGYNRTDLRIEYAEQKNTYSYTFYLDLINAFNQLNILSYKYVLFINDPNPEEVPSFLRVPSSVTLRKEPIYMFPLIPTFGFNISF